MLIFQLLKAFSFILDKFTFEILVEQCITLTIKNSNISSANSFGFDNAMSSKSLTYIKNNKGFRIEPSGTPWFTCAHEEF